MRKHEQVYDVVVIGSGGAGLRAAISAAEAGGNVLVIAKGKINRSGATLLAGANLSADIACDGHSLYEMGITDANKDDSKELWFNDTIHEGFYLNNQELVEVFVEEAADCIRELISWGMQVNGTEGERGISVYGSAILDALYRRLRELRVAYAEDTVVTDIVTSDGAVQGVVCMEIASGEVTFIPANAVVAASGGAHNLFRQNSGPTDCCGEGQGAACRAGAELIDMEMISFCPAVIQEPLMYRGNILPYIINTIGYGTFLNKFGKAFTDRFLSKDVEILALETEWNKMLLSFALQKEIDEGRGNIYGGIYYALNLQPEELNNELYHDFPGLDAGIYRDIIGYMKENHALSVKPSAHYFEGGIRINKKMETNIRGLFAAGECAGGLFGANRVSAATTEMLIEGKISGRVAAEYAAVCKAKPVSDEKLSEIEGELMAPFARNSDTSVVELKKTMQAIAMRALSVIRHEDTLREAEQEIEALKAAISEAGLRGKAKAYNKEWLDYLQMRNGIYTLQAIVRSARLRKESRGVHVRGDYYFTDNKNYLGSIVIKNTQMESEFVPPVVTKMDLEDAGVHSYTAYIEETINKLS